MTKEYFAPARHQMTLPGSASGVDGGVIFPAGVAYNALIRRDLEKTYPHLRRRLIDPQFYLATLLGARCRKACVNLASYGWFPTDGFENYDTEKHGKQNQWKKNAKNNIEGQWTGTLPTDEKGIEKAVRVCVDVQASVGCESIILPAPLITELFTDFSVEGTWLDAGLRLAANSGRRRLATVAISDSCMRPVPPEKNDLIEMIIDQVSAREPEGVYLVIETSQEGYYNTDPNTLGSMLRLVHGFKEAGVATVVVSLAGVAGLLALAVGADMICTAWYRSERRLKLADFDDKEGRAVPTYYSHALASEVDVKEDLDRLTASGLLDELTDVTPASRPLINALRTGKSVSAVADWEYRIGNVKAAREHFMTVLVRETREFAKLSDAQQRERALSWLIGAEALAKKIAGLGAVTGRSEIQHQRPWRIAFEKFLAGAK
jgi:hypothetical protein